MFTFHGAIFDSAGWSSLVARRAHNPEVGGSNPPPATIFILSCALATLLISYSKATNKILLISLNNDPYKIKCEPHRIVAYK